ncbi:hypothetical protein FACS1894189_3590 [Planctomycetales bacterium]|nr:hypothetical protein FACS1894189_3590 [Planctomycetales bacterium]
MTNDLQAMLLTQEIERLNNVIKLLKDDNSFRQSQVCERESELREAWRELDDLKFLQEQKEQ